MKRSAGLALGVGITAGVAGVFAVITVIRAAFGFELALTETIMGAAFGTALLASTAIVAATSVGTKDLKTLVLASYTTKVSVLLLVALVFPFENYDRIALAVSTVAGALTYLTAFTIVQPRPANVDQPYEDVAEQHR